MLAARVGLVVGKRSDVLPNCVANVNGLNSPKQHSYVKAARCHCRLTKAYVSWAATQNKEAETCNGVFCFQLFTGADPAVPGPAGGRGEATGPEVVLHRPGFVPQRAPSLRTQKGLGAPLTRGKSVNLHIRNIVISKMGWVW